MLNSFEPFRRSKDENPILGGTGERQRGNRSRRSGEKVQICLEGMSA